ncbi:MAG: SsrA-binding protein, partial [Myxococcota bacterium]
ELEKLEEQQRIKGLSIVPLSLYFKGGWLKVELGIGKGKTNIDRRNSIKDRDIKREVDRALRRR